MIVDDTMPDMYYEDLSVGGVTKLGTYTVTEQEIVQFAERYDPLPFHIDLEAAEQSVHDGIIASGYHTLSLVNRIIVDEFEGRMASVAGLGINDLRWHAPVRPGDTLVVFHELIEKRVSKSRPELGITREQIQARNQHDHDIISFTTAGMVRRRDTDIN